MSAVITASGLGKRYKSAVALDNVSFQVEPGRIVGLIGPNGAGKTTALKAILGLTDFTGELNVLGMDPRRQRGQLMGEVCFIADVAVYVGLPLITISLMEIERPVGPSTAVGFPSLSRIIILSPV